MSDDAEQSTSNSTGLTHVELLALREGLLSDSQYESALSRESFLEDLLQLLQTGDPNIAPKQLLGEVRSAIKTQWETIAFSTAVAMLRGWARAESDSQGEAVRLLGELQALHGQLQRRTPQPRNSDRDSEIVRLRDSESLTFGQIGRKLLNIDSRWGDSNGKPLSSDAVKKAYKREKERIAGQNP